MTFSPSNEYLASSSSDGNVIIWDVSVGCCHSPLHTLQPRHGAIWSIAFSPDGHSLASASTDGRVALWCVVGVLGCPLGSISGSWSGLGRPFWGSGGTPGRLWRAGGFKDRFPGSVAHHFSRFWSRKGAQMAPKTQQKSLKIN